MDEDLIKVEFPYNEPLVRLMQSIPGRKWRPLGKYWTIPRTIHALKQTVQTFNGHSIQIDPDLPQLSQKRAHIGHPSQVQEPQPRPSTPGASLSQSPNPPSVHVPDTGALPDHDRRIGISDRRILHRLPVIDRRGTNFADMVVRQLRIRNYSNQTIKLYKNILIDLSRYFSKPLNELSNDDLVQYLSYLVENRHVSASRISQVISSLKFLYVKLLDRKDIVFNLEHPRKYKKLPTVLDKEDVLAILNSVSNPKHRLMLEIMYSSGMRVSEVSRIRVRDFDLNSLTLFVRAGKGNKDRLTMISDKSLDLLNTLLRNKQGDDFVFTGAGGDRPISSRTIQHVFNTALQHSGIRKKASCHTFRHSFATHLMESGTALPYIKDLLGHKSIKTTEIYTQVRRPNKRNIKSPL